MDAMDYQKLFCIKLKSFETNKFFHGSFNRIQKSRSMAQSISDIGDELFDKCSHDAPMHEKIFELYSKFKALVPHEPDQYITAYWKSAQFLYHVGKYEECLIEIDRALKMDSSIHKAELILLKERSARKQKEKEMDLSLGFKEKLNIVSSNITDGDIEGDDPQETIDKSYLDILSKVKSKQVFENVKVNQNFSYGKHLVTTRDILPGEIIMVSESYVNVPNYTRNQSYCNHCLMPAWTGIPCPNCPCAMYCSEKCYNKALQMYHDIECLCLQFIISGNNVFDYYMHTSLRSVIKGVKEFQNLANFRKEVDSARYKSDTKILAENVMFNKDSFLSLFIYKNVNLDHQTLNKLAFLSCKAVISLVKCTQFFGNNCKSNTIEDILENEDVIFIGTLLLEISAIAYKNSIKVFEQNAHCSNRIDGNVCNAQENLCCERGYSFSTLATLIPHSCSPNVKSLKTLNGEEFWYSLVPIEKGSELLECYGSTFYEMHYDYRKDFTAQLLDRLCTCIACVQRWTAKLIVDEKIISFPEVFQNVLYAMETDSEKEQFCNFVMKNGLLNQEVVNELSRLIEETDNFVVPTFVTCNLMYLLNYVMNGLYGHYLNMPIVCETP